MGDFSQSHTPPTAVPVITDAQQAAMDFYENVQLFVPLCLFHNGVGVTEHEKPRLLRLLGNVEKGEKAGEWFIPDAAAHTYGRPQNEWIAAVRAHVVSRVGATFPQKYKVPSQMIDALEAATAVEWSVACALESAKKATEAQAQR